jgi:hypothetical protein
MRTPIPERYNNGSAVHVNHFPDIPVAAPDCSRFFLSRKNTAIQTGHFTPGDGLIPGVKTKRAEP